MRTAGRLARDLGAAVALVHVVDEVRPLSDLYTFTPTFLDPIVVVPSPEGTEAVLRATRRAAGEALLRVAESGLGMSARVERMVREGAAVEQIVAAAREWQADVVVIGAHARGRLDRFLLGSTAEQVIGHARCAVLTVTHHPPEP